MVIPLSAASSPRSKLLLDPPSVGGGDGGGCRSPALSPAASGPGVRRPEPQSCAHLPAASRSPGAPHASLALAFPPYRAAASSLPVLRHLRLQGSGMPLSLGSGRRGPRLLSSCLRLSASTQPTSPESRRARGEGRGGRPRRAGAPRRRRPAEGGRRAGRARLRRPGARRRARRGALRGAGEGLSKCCAGRAWVPRLLRSHCCLNPTRPR